MRRWVLCGAGVAWLVAPSALAQSGEDAGSDAPAGGAAAPAGGSTTVTTFSTPPWGFPQPGTDINEGLPSSSRPSATGESSDRFDLNQRGADTGPLRGNKDSPAMLAEPEVAGTPRLHTVKRGDTLWDLSANYFRNPWKWPELWAQNPQIQNPNWIYPGDQLKLRSRELTAGRSGALRNERGFLERPQDVPPGTVFTRNQGYLGDPSRDTWGELVGSKDDQMLLSDGDTVYLKLKDGVSIQPGQALTLFREVRKAPRVKDARTPKGTIVAVQGTVEVTSFDAKKRIARARIVESLDAIERGLKVGPVGRRFEAVPPKASNADVVATLLTGFYPHVYFGGQQIALIDRGSKDGLEPGTVLRVLRTGDPWRRDVKDKPHMLRERMRVDVEESARHEPTPLNEDPKDFPEELVGELRVLRVQEESAVVMVTRADRELVPGDRAVARKGK
jgi:hypothetical protein